MCSLFTLFSVLFFAALEDVRSGRIPNSVFLAGIGLTGLCRLLEPEAFPGGTEGTMAAAITGVLLLYCTGKMGGGDIKMFIFILLLVPGGKGIMLIWYALVFSALGGLYGFVRFGNRRIRLGPGMLLGAATAMMMGDLV